MSDAARLASAAAGLVGLTVAVALLALAPFLVVLNDGLLVVGGFGLTTLAMVVAAASCYGLAPAVTNGQPDRAYSFVTVGFYLVAVVGVLHALLLLTFGGFPWNVGAALLPAAVARLLWEQAGAPAGERRSS